eukprot:m.385825 g.385825  ORF g.385825 m.385825 type:complete len:53 (-) comp16743_c0_seq3:274-432(-)
MEKCVSCRCPQLTALGTARANPTEAAGINRIDLLFNDGEPPSPFPSQTSSDH